MKLGGLVLYSKLLEEGTDLRYIQKLLSHTSIKRTEIYTHVVRTSINKLRNPQDDIFE
ncbi:MAG: tyrosine-type recombinase/integrase [Bacteroidales bacterium]